MTKLHVVINCSRDKAEIGMFMKPELTGSFINNIETPTRENRITALRYIIYFTTGYPQVFGLAVWSENYKWYSSLPLGAFVSLFCESV
jgi:hypothetical protein